MSFFSGASRLLRGSRRSISVEELRDSNPEAWLARNLILQIFRDIAASGIQLPRWATEPTYSNSITHRAATGEKWTDFVSIVCRMLLSVWVLAPLWYTSHHWAMPLEAE